MAATFKSATDVLLRFGYTAEAIGEAAGVSANSVLRARRSSGQIRPAPRNWRPALKALADDGAAVLSSLAAELADA